MLTCYNDEEAGIPVTEEGKEVLEDGEDVVASCDGECDYAAEEEERPEKSWDYAERACKLLDGERAGVDGDTIHTDT